MNLHFETVNPANRREVEKLQILPEQADFIESVSDCMSEADEVQEWRPVGIYDGELLIGFAMYGYFKKLQSKGEAWI